MYEVTITDRWGRQNISMMPAENLADFVMHNSIGGLEYSGSRVIVRMSAEDEIDVSFEAKVAWAESYLGLNLMGCC